MTTDNRTNEPSDEQILVDEWIRQADRAKSMTGMDAIWFPDAEETLAVLRANGLLSEGTPSEQQVEWAARAFFREYHGEDIWPELRDDGELDTRSRALAATRVALTTAGVAPREPSRLPDFFAPKPMPNSYVPAPVLPSSAESPVEPFKTWFACWWKNEPNAIAESNAQSAFYAGWDARGLPSSGVDEDKLAEVIGKVTDLWDEPLDEVHDIPQIARAVAEWLKGQGNAARE